MSRRSWIGSSVLFAVVLAAAVGLSAWKRTSLQAADAAASSQPEPVERVDVVSAGEREHVHTTTSIGTVVALRSITLRNEIAGTVREIALEPGKLVEAGTLLVALDVSVEQAELEALEAQAVLAETLLGRVKRASENRGASEMDVDRARAERDVALANVARTKAVIARKTIRAPFRARVGLSDVHVGQYLNEGTELTTLQGVDEVVHVDFPVPQEVAARLSAGMSVEVTSGSSSEPTRAIVVAVDAKVDPATRNAVVRAAVSGAESFPAPGSSVRVRVPVGAPRPVVVVPASALRKGPTGDHVFVVADDESGRPRAHLRHVEGGTMLGDEVVIRSGLAAGERVASSGSFKLREAVLVSIANESGASDH